MTVEEEFPVKAEGFTGATLTPQDALSFDGQFSRSGEQVRRGASARRAGR
jgi:hypothetical protein